MVAGPHASVISPRPRRAHDAAVLLFRPCTLRVAGKWTRWSAQNDDRNDRAADRHDSGDSGRQVHPGHECLAGDREEDRADLGRQLGRNRHRTAQGVTRHSRRFRRNGRRKVIGELVPIDRHADAAEDRDTKCSTKLCCRLADARRCPGLLGRCGADDQLGGQSEHGRQPKGDDHRASHECQQPERHRCDGTHVIVYSKNAEADPAFLRDHLGLAGVDAWTIWMLRVCSWSTRR